MRDVVNSPRYDVPGFTGKFTQAVRVAPGLGLLFVSGLTARDDTGEIRGKGDIAEQTEWVLRGLAEVCRAAGAGMDDVVKVTVFVRNADDMPIIRRIKHKHFGDPAPASTTVEVSRLFDPAQLIEIEAVVALRA
jgi:enamine deaminase RidA (YjgF/YER057c/UK114 family)